MLPFCPNLLACSGIYGICMSPQFFNFLEPPGAPNGFYDMGANVVFGSYLDFAAL